MGWSTSYCRSISIKSCKRDDFNVYKSFRNAASYYVWPRTITRSLHLYNQFILSLRRKATSTKILQFIHLTNCKRISIDRLKTWFILNNNTVKPVETFRSNDGALLFLQCKSRRDLHLTYERPLRCLLQYFSNNYVSFGKWELHKFYILKKKMQINFCFSLSHALIYIYWKRLEGNWRKLKKTFEHPFRTIIKTVGRLSSSYRLKLPLEVSYDWF